MNIKQKPQLTPEQSARLASMLATGGIGRCPYCDSINIEAQRPDGEGLLIWQDVWCHACGQEWKEVAKLDRIETVDGEHILMRTEFATKHEQALSLLRASLAMLNEIPNHRVRGGATSYDLAASLDRFLRENP